MFNLDYFYSMYMFLISGFLLSFYYKYIMLLVISLEYMMIWIAFNMYSLVLNLEGGMFMLLFFLVISVCEGALVLSLLVTMVRFQGNDSISSLMVMKW